MIHENCMKFQFQWPQIKFNWDPVNICIGYHYFHHGSSNGDYRASKG